MRRRRPALVKRSLKFHRPDPKAWPVTAVGVLAADADLTHPGEVIVVVLLNIVARVIVDRALEHIFPQRRTRHLHRPLHRRKRTSTIPAQAQVHAEPRRAFFELHKPLGQFRVLRHRRQYHPLRHAAGAIPRAHLHWPGREPKKGEGGFAASIDQFAPVDFQSHILHFHRRCLHEPLARRQQRLQLGYIERAPIQPHLVDIALELLGVLDTADMQIHFRIIQHARFDRPHAHLVTIHVHTRLILAATHHRCHVLPFVHADDARA